LRKIAQGGRGPPQLRQAAGEQGIKTMKSERRHELQHNELAEWLIRAGETIKPYQNAIFAVVAGIVVLVIGYNIWSRMAASQAAEAWNEVNVHLENNNFPKLADVVENYPNTTAAHMAGVVLADWYLQQGCAQLFVNKAGGQAELTKAITLYEQVREQSRQAALLERATFGLARAKEAKGDADSIKMAEGLYAEVVQKWPKCAFATAAKQRADDLKRPEIKTLYDKFRDFDPKPAFSKDQGKPTFDLNSLPKEGSTKVDSTLDLKFGDKEKAKEPEKAKTAEKKEPEKKAPEKKAEEPKK
jgi:hypothetical protein